jgi:aminomethyltransferase
MNITTLHEVHLRLGAHMTSFAGWSAPLDYGSILQEAKAVRSTAGLFDISHMGRIEVRGADSFALLQRLVTADLGRLQPDRAQYTLMCNPRGGIIDDLIVFSMESDRYLLVVNAANTCKDVHWLASNASRSVVVEDLTSTSCLFALQGPSSRDILAGVLGQPPELARFGWKELSLCGANCIVSRTGYTGEDGYEFMCADKDAETVWETFRTADLPVSPTLCGLGARDVLRVEAGFVLYGNDIDEEKDPIEAGLTRFVRFDKEEFVGKQALSAIMNKGPRRMLVGIRMVGRPVPRQGMQISSGSSPIGFITSGTYSPAVSSGIGLGYVASEKSASGVEVEILQREKPYAGRVVTTPFYRVRESV